MRKYESVRIQIKYWALVIFVGGQVATGWSQELVQKPVALQEVVINGSQSDTEARSNFVAGKIVIGRKRIGESGLQNVAEILRREPAITVGKDGRIGLLGLPGYTQVLVDGAPPPPGKEPTDLDLIHVEKIEIVKSSVAEFGPFGVAGTINIVTRKIERKNSTQMNLGTSSLAGMLGSDLSLSHNHSDSGSPLSFNVRLSANQKTTSVESSLTQTVSLLELPQQAQWEGQTLADNRFSSQSASSTVSWQADARNKITFSPSISKMSTDQVRVEHRRWSDGNTLNAQEQTSTPLDTLWSSLSWAHTSDEKGRMELSWTSNHFRSNTETRREVALSSQPATLRRNTQRIETDTDFLKLDYKIGLSSGHDVKAGGHVGRNSIGTEYAYWINGIIDTSLDALGMRREVQQDQRRLFLQDDWRLNDTLALNVGVSGEERVIDLAEGSYRSQARYRMWSPSMHVAKKLTGDSKRQIRISLARTYHAPSLDELTLRPQIHPLAPCPANGLCAGNTIDTADTSGNPSLQPERALGLNISYEHGVGPDSQFVLELYARNIEGKTGTDIVLENVPWSNSPRYVSQPANLGDASVRGIDLEMQLAMRDAWKDAPKLDLRGSIGLARSQISNVPGPENRLDSQTPWRAKLGGSYAVDGLPIKLNVDANWAPAGWVRVNTAQRVFLDRNFDLSANVSWIVQPNMRLVVNVDNLFARPSRRIDEYIASDELVRQQVDTTKHTKIGLRLEMKL